VSHALDTALDEARRREQQRAVRALLRRPLLLEGADEFRLVRRYATELREWFDANTGWRLHVDTEVARLVKRPATLDDPSHPAREPRSHVAFGRRRYVLTCLALAVLERADAQITLGRRAPNRSFTASSGGSPTSIAATGVTARANRGPRSRSSPRRWSGSRRCA
jgi:hypothetical protein